MELLLENPTDEQLIKFIADQRKLNPDVSLEIWERYQSYVWNWTQENCVTDSPTVDSFNDWYFFYGPTGE